MITCRTKALAGFKDGRIPILVATDIASRGIDVDGITHVFNYDLPNEPESYVHRIGRTARAGRSGIAYGFCDNSESGYLVGIQQLIGDDIPVDDSHDFHFVGAIPKPGQRPGKIKENKGPKKKKFNNKNTGNRGDKKPSQSNRRSNNNSRSGNNNRGRRRDNRNSHGKSQSNRQNNRR